MGFHFLHSRIMQLWKPAGRLDCIDLGEDFFLIKFGLIQRLWYCFERGAVVYRRALPHYTSMGTVVQAQRHCLFQSGCLGSSPSSPYWVLWYGRVERDRECYRSSLKDWCYHNFWYPWALCEDLCLSGPCETFGEESLHRMFWPRGFVWGH